MSSVAAALAQDEMTNDVLAVFAQVTRYPLEVLDPEAPLEEELGIDSVKLGEVFAVLRTRYALPDGLALPLDRLRTIRAIADALAEVVAAGSNGQGGSDHGANVHGGNGHGGRAPAAMAPAPAANAPAPPAIVPAPAAITAEPAAAPPRPPKHGNGSLEPAAFEAGVREVFAAVTRYPAEILDVRAPLEEELGVDSVKLGEVFAVLRQKYDLPEQLGVPPEDLRSIGSIAAALRRYLLEVEAAAVPAPAAPVAPAAGPVQLASAGAPGAAPAGAIFSPPALTPFPAAAQSFAALTPALRPFSGKVALVTGSGRGLGKDIACYLAELGASVVINSFHSRQQGIDTTMEIRERGGDALHVWGSVAKAEHLDAMFGEVEARFGGLDFFVSSASNGMLARLEDVTPEHWEKAFRTNVVGLHQGALRAARLMRCRGGGKIVTLSSPAAHGYVDYFGCMGAVKAAVESLTRSLAVELADDNIQVNCVSPGPVYGELLEKWPESGRLVAQWEANTAYRRLCEARDVSHFVAYLLSEPVKLFTGSVLVIDGGISSQGW
jgi:enoyl-[acyl-carrier protein] reductase III